MFAQIRKNVVRQKTLALILPNHDESVHFSIFVRTVFNRLYVFYKLQYMRKLNISAVLLILLSALPSFGQDNYKVIKVNGTILLKAKGISLQTGTVFSETDGLVFNSDDATAAVINSRKGRLILTSKNHDISTASSNSLPAMYNIASRGATLISLKDLQNYFSGKFAVLNTQFLVLHTASFPMDNQNFFFLRYPYKGQEINKKLDFSGDTLIISRSKLYTVDGKPIPSPDNAEISLFYRKGSESLLVNKFDLIFPDEKQLKKEVQVILDEFAGKTYKEKVNEIDSFINENYGKVSMENLRSWLKINFNIKAE